MSRAYLNTQNTQVIHDLGDIYELHRTISRLFPVVSINKSFRTEFNVLYRIESNKDYDYPFLLIQSNLIPKWEQFLERHPNYFRGCPESRELNPFLEKLSEGQVCIFRLKANPVKRPPPKKFGKGEYRGNTNRIPIQKEENLIKWIIRKGKSAGFGLINIKADSRDLVKDIRISTKPKISNKAPFRYRKVTGKKKRHIITFHSVLFEGRLKIIEIEAFKNALINGIGPGKAFGFGMLSIYPIKKKF